MAQENLTNVMIDILGKSNFIFLSNEVSITWILWMSPSLVYIQIQVKNSKNRVILNQESTRCFDAKLGLHKIKNTFSSSCKFKQLRENHQKNCSPS